MHVGEEVILIWRYNDILNDGLMMTVIHDLQWSLRYTDLPTECYSIKCVISVKRDRARCTFFENATAWVCQNDHLRGRVWRKNASSLAGLIVRTLDTFYEHYIRNPTALKVWQRHSKIVDKNPCAIACPQMCTIAHMLSDKDRINNRPVSIYSEMTAMYHRMVRLCVIACFLLYAYARRCLFKQFKKIIIPIGI